MNKESALRNLAKEGCIAAFYTKDKWFCKIKLCLTIDKVLFSFAEIGSNGKGFDIYVDVIDFAVWCDEIAGLTFFTQINKEKAAGKKYPEHYKYITGNNGEKQVGFCPSTLQECIALNGKSGEKHCIIPIPIIELQKMAKLFGICIRKYYNEVEDMVLAGMADASKYRKSSDAEEATANEKPKEAVYSLTSMTKMELFKPAGAGDNEPNFRMKAKGPDGKVYEVSFLSAFVKKSREVFNSLAEYLIDKPVGTPISIRAVETADNRLRFLKFERGGSAA